jgi:uncharacterized protein YceK
MKPGRKLILALAASILLSGCGTLNSLTGQTDNTVLPGQREDAIPGRTKFPEKQDVARADAPGSANAETYCAPGDAACKPPSTTGDIFKDPQ